MTGRIVELGDAHGGELEVRLLADRVPRGDRQLVRGARVRRRPRRRLVPVAVVEGHEDDARADVADPRRRLASRRAGTRRATMSPSSMPEPVGVRGAISTQASGAARVQLRRAAGLGAGVEVVDDAAGGQQQRVVVVRLLGRRLVLARLAGRPGRAGRFARYSSAVIVRAGDQVVAVGLAVVGGRC